MLELSNLDFIAVAIFFACWTGYGAYAGHVGNAEKNINGSMYHWRRVWMRRMLTRDNRILDVQVTRGLLGNAAFFGSASIFILAGLVALLGYSEKATEVLDGFTFTVHTTQNQFGLKVALLLFIFIFVFFKHAWAMRQHGYSAILIGAAPHENTAGTPEADEHAERAAEISSRASNHYNSGMRGYYFGLAAVAWFLHPALLIAASVWTIAVLYRREFKSRALEVLLEGGGRPPE